MSYKPTFYADPWLDRGKSIPAADLKDEIDAVMAALYEIEKVVSQATVTAGDRTGVTFRPGCGPLYDFFDRASGKWRRPNSASTSLDIWTVDIPASGSSDTEFTTVDIPVGSRAYGSLFFGLEIHVRVMNNGLISPLDSGYTSANGLIIREASTPEDEDDGFHIFSGVNDATIAWVNSFNQPRGAGQGQGISRVFLRNVNNQWSYRIGTSAGAVNGLEMQLRVTEVFY